jgi:hypothetical protein
MNVEPIAAAGRISEMGSTVLVGALNLYQNLLQTQYSQESARAEEEGKTKRSEAMYNRLDKYFSFASSAVGEQVGAYIKRKMGGGNAATEEQSRQARRAAAQTERAKATPTETETVEEDETEDDIEHPVAVLCEVFGSSLTPKQHKKMREVFSPEIMDLFVELFCSETDDEAVEIFQLIKSSAPLPQLIELHALLDAEQMGLYKSVSKAVDKITAEEPETDDVDDEAEGDDADEPGTDDD